MNMSDRGKNDSVAIVTGADAFHFSNVTMLIASWKAHHPDFPLLVCDYGLKPEQVTLLQSIPGVQYAAGPARGYPHAWEAKARLGSFVAALPTARETIVWIDADALFLQALPDVSELISGYDIMVDAHVQSIGEVMHEINRTTLGMRSDDAYFSSGFWIVRRACLLDSWARLVATVKGQGNLWENDAFVAAIYAEKLKVRTLAGGVWHARGKTSLHTCQVNGLEASHGGYPVYVLHANDGYTVRADGRRIFKRPELAAIQDHYEKVFWTEICPRGRG